MAKLDRVLEAITKREGMTELEIARVLFGPNAIQPMVNAECRMLIAMSKIRREGIGGGKSPFTYVAT